MSRREHSDSNQKQIVRTLRSVGASVAITAKVGNGFPDLVVGYRGEDRQLEVKVPGWRTRCGGRRQKQTLERQAEHRRTWKGTPPKVVTTQLEALVAIGYLEETIRHVAFARRLPLVT